MPAPLLASAADLGVHLQYTVSDAQAALALAGASGAVRSHCGWVLTRETTTLVADGTGTTLLTLPTLNLVSVSEVRIGGLAIDPSVVQPRPLDRGQLVWDTAWPINTRIEADVVHGYTTVPDVVRLVTLTIASRIINNPENTRTASVGTVTRTFDPRLTELDIRLLDPYRL